MNIIFLDVDGVLNSIENTIKEYEKTHIRRSGYNYPFDNIGLKNLKKLVIQTNFKLLITSIWLYNSTGINVLLSKLKEYNLDKYVIGYTPILDGNREIEIKTFLSNLNYKPNFIILDDKLLRGDLLPYLIQINTRKGLTINDVEEAKKTFYICF